MICVFDCFVLLGDFVFVEMLDNVLIGEGNCVLKEVMVLFGDRVV